MLPESFAQGRFIGRGQHEVSATKGYADRVF